jgi:hypothetical protein
MCPKLRRDVDHEHNTRSRVLADAVAHQSRIAQIAAGTDEGAAARRRAAVLSRRARTEDGRYYDAVTSGDHERYFAWHPAWWRDGRLLGPR